MLESAEAVELPPANAYIRRLQHQMAERYNLARKAGAANRTAGCASTGKRRET